MARERIADIIAKDELPAIAGKLTAVKVKAMNTPGAYADGGNLYLRVASNASGTITKSWLFRYMMCGKAHNMGLGSVNDVSLAQARKDAQDCRGLVHKGVDPIEAYRAALIANATASAKATAIPTFGEFAETWIAGKEENKWTDPREGQRWRSTLRRYAAPLMTMRLDAIETPHVLAIIEPMWSNADTHNMAQKVLRQIAAILKSATIRGHRSGQNPAEWDGYLEDILHAPKDAPAVEHMAAMPYHDVPAFITELHGMGDVRAKAIEFVILTGARAGEVLGGDRKGGMTWLSGEIDFDAKVWTVPAERMKNKRPHRVPLCDRAVAILREMEASRTDERVFPTGYSNVAKWVTKRFKGGVVLHGFRSAFRDWGTEAMHPSQLLEFSLSHYDKDEGNKVDAKTRDAYRRTDQLENRRPIMNAWGEFCGEASPVQQAA